MNPDRPPSRRTPFRSSEPEAGDFPVEISRGADSPLSGIARQLTLRGLHIDLSEPLLVGQEVGFRLNAMGSPLQARASVSRCTELPDERYRVVLTFTSEMSAAECERLVRLQALLRTRG